MSMLKDAVRGVVKFFSDQRGYGFILPEDGTKEVFVHFSTIEDEERYKSLKEGDPVEYELTQTERGPATKKVRRIRS